jgi:LmbE family N-acetylglucosaminyl deacetylase
VPRRLLAVFAHPDDESFTSGGTFALLAASRVQICLVTATRGELGAGPDAAHLSREALAELRGQELQSACQVLGISPPIFLGLPDGSVAGFGLDRVATRIASAARAFDPHLVVTFGPDGAYGHPDHVAIGRATTVAFGRGLGRRLLHVAYPAGLFRPQYDGMLTTAFEREMRATDPALLGLDTTHAGVCIDIRAFAEAKLSAIAAHASQLQRGDPRTLFPPGIVDATLADEWFALAGGPPLRAQTADPFEGL